jgi:hypothetical protein
MSPSSSALYRALQQPGITFQALVEEITNAPIDDPNTEGQRADLLKDLRWLLVQGYALYTEGGHLHVPKKPIKDRPKLEQASHLKGIANQKATTETSNTKAPSQTPANQQSAEPKDHSSSTITEPLAANNSLESKPKLPTKVAKQVSSNHAQPSTSTATQAKTPQDNSAAPATEAEQISPAADSLPDQRPDPSPNT